MCFGVAAASPTLVILLLVASIKFSIFPPIFPPLPRLYERVGSICSMSQELTSLAHMAELQETSKVEVIVYTKSDKTLKQNMNAKDETLRKRTSLIIVPQQVADDDEQQQQQQQQHQLEQLENGNRNSIASMDSCLSSQSNQSSPDAGIDADGDADGGNSSSSSSSSSDDAHAAYQDLQNGNGGSKGDGTHGLHSPSCSSSSTSSESTSCCSSVDYSLREQLQNFANCAEVEQLKCVNDLPTAAQLLKGMSLPMEQAVSPHCDALLSPQEVPLGRRYAEVAQFKALSNKAR